MSGGDENPVLAAVVPPGWYPDPTEQAPFRWWNGTTWTERTASSVTGAVAEPAVEPAEAEPSPSQPSSPPPGWYPDPTRQAPFRWWDGTTWSEATTTTADAGPFSAASGGGEAHGTSNGSPESAPDGFTAAPTAARGFRLDIAMFVLFGLSMLCWVISLSLSGGINSSKPTAEIIDAWDSTQGMQAFGFGLGGLAAILALVLLVRRTAAWRRAGIPGAARLPGIRLVAAWVLPIVHFVGIPWSIARIEKLASQVGGQGEASSAARTAGVVWAIAAAAGTARWWQVAFGVRAEFDRLAEGTGSPADRAQVIDAAPDMFQAAAISALVALPALMIAVRIVLQLIRSADPASQSVI